MRIGPNEVMVASPLSLKVIYGKLKVSARGLDIAELTMVVVGAGSSFRKGDWYQATAK